jgi:hypothetical protein
VLLEGEKWNEKDAATGRATGRTKTGDGVVSGTVPNQTITGTAFNDLPFDPGGALLSDATPQALGTAAAGTAATASRGDHRHAMPTAAQVGADPAGTAAAAVAAAATSYATAAQGTRADSAVQPAGLSSYLTSATAATIYQPLSANLTALGTNGAAYYLARGNHTGTQAASTITGLATVATSGAYADLSGTPTAFNPASPGAIGGTTPAAGSFTALSAGASLLVPSAAASTPAAGHVYRVTDQLRYRDSSNAEQVVLYGGGNLTNLANAATARTNLGIGTLPSGALVGTSDAQTLTGKTLGSITETVFTITDVAAFEINPANGPIQLITLGANRTPAATSFASGQSVTLMIDDGTAFAITWSTVAVTWVGGSAPTLATTGRTVIELWKVASTIYGALVGNVA